jgi:hypothetical protein
MLGASDALGGEQGLLSQLYGREHSHDLVMALAQPVNAGCVGVDAAHETRHHVGSLFVNCAFWIVPGWYNKGNGGRGGRGVPGAGSNHDGTRIPRAVHLLYLFSYQIRGGMMLY